MSSIEDRLREAYQEAAGTVRPQSVREEPGVGRDLGRTERRGRAEQARRARSRGVGTAVAAAAAVAAIALGASVVGTRIAADQHQAPGSARPASAATAGPGATPAAAGGYPAVAAPRFVVELRHLAGHGQVATALTVYDTATGRPTGRLGSPRRNVYFQAIAALGSNREFVAIAGPGQVAGKPCDSWLYRFRLTAQGRPVDLGPLLPRQAGLPAPAAVGGFAAGTLAASADGGTVAFTVLNCHISSKTAVRDYGRIEVLRLASGAARTWTFRSPAEPDSLSLSADGSVLGMVSNPSNGTLSSSPQFNSAWELVTSSRAGQLGDRYRQVIGRSTSPLAAELSPTGTTMTAAIPRYTPRRPRPWQVTLASRSTTPGGRARILNVLPPERMLDESLAFTPDASGRYLLMSQYGARLLRIDLATGQLTTLRQIGTASPAAIAW